MTPYSSSGPTWYDGLVKPDVIAPGHMLTSEAAPRSALFKEYPTLHKRAPSGKEFETLSGTSMSAAVVTGVVAVLEQAHRPRADAEPGEGRAAVHRHSADAKTAAPSIRCARAPGRSTRRAP